MSKTDYLKMLRTVHPGEDETVYELARQFHSMTKAKHYIALLETCNTNADIAWKAMRAMYVSGDIDEIKAMSRKFIRSLLPFVCLEKQGKPNSIAYHVKAMLNDDTVRKERQEFQERQKAAIEAASHELQPVQVALPKISEGIILQITPNPDNQDFFRQLLELIRQGQIQVIQVQNSGSETVAQENPHPNPSARCFTLRVNAQSKARVLALARTHIQIGIPSKPKSMLAMVVKRLQAKKGSSRNVISWQDRYNLKSQMATRLAVQSLLKQVNIKQPTIELPPTLSIASLAFPDRDKLKMLCRHKDVTIWEVK